MAAVKRRSLTQQKLTEKEKTILKNHYYNASKPGSLGGVKPLADATNMTPQKVRAWLTQQRTYSLHKPVRKKFPTRRYIARGINYQWQADLVEMQHYARENDGYRYILTIIDVFSRFAYAKALKTKSGYEVSEAMKTIFRENNISPLFLQTDLGKEFYNHHVQNILDQYKVEHFSVFSERKAALVERFNRTLKDKMFRAFTFQGSHKWVQLLPLLLHNYNHNYHRIIKRTPASVTKNNETDVWITQYSSVQKPSEDFKTKFAVGDLVRISKHRSIFSRGFLPGWSEEEFIIINTNKKYKPVLYTLSDLNGEVLKGSFYSQELQKVENPNSVYTIEKVIETKGKGSQKKALVKWLGYKALSWIPYSNIKSIHND